MNFHRIFLVLVFLAGIPVYSYAQGLPPDAQGQINRQNEERRIQRENDDRMRRSSQINGMQNPKGNGVTVYKKPTLNKKDRELRDRIVAPDADDLGLLQDFLKQPNTGVFRLFPDYDCYTKGILKVDGKCQGIYPGTWFYSFREKDYSDGFFFDLQLKNGKLITDGFLSQGILTRLGNFSLDKVTLQTKGAGFLVGFLPAKKESDVKTQTLQIADGIEADGFKYSKEAPAKVGEVYLLRVVAYRIQGRFLAQATEKEGTTPMLYSLLNQDKRDDLTVAFRIIRAKADGNLTIVWKVLDKKKAPEIIFSK
ncbi:MAG TPA: hypothetical protein VNB22_15960 [Pyrinomonadaceae bacterium]|jgi:hypothetical protein|nr:hypothetical protein [Pyrinomonadaceae bacterium]